MNYPIAPNGIIDTIQGEGVLLGTPMTFIRLAGCSVGCKECDTDYRVHERLSVAEIIERIQRLPIRKWVWLTGGEPTDHDVRPLTASLRRIGCYVAMPTNGRKKLGDGWNGWLSWADHIYVSCHDAIGPVQTIGNELNVVPGLNGLSLADVAKWNVYGFPDRRVTPCDGNPASLAACLEFVRNNNGWRLGIQAHKTWGVA